MNTKTPQIAFMGDLTADVYVETNTVKYGGAALNSAIWTQREGGEPTIISAIGSDVIGKKYFSFVKEQKLNTIGIQKKRGATSSISIFLQDGERRYGPWKPGVLADIHLRAKDKTLLSRLDAVVITAYPQYEHILREFAAWKKTNPQEKRPLFVINFGDLREFESNIEVVRQHLSLADVLVFGLDKDQDESLINQIRELSAQRLCIVTLGKYGSIAWKDGASIVQVAQEVKKVVDTTGAGDSFLSAFLVSYMKTQAIQVALKKGSATAALTIQRMGAY